MSSNPGQMTLDSAVEQIRTVFRNAVTENQSLIENLLTTGITSAELNEFYGRVSSRVGVTLRNLFFVQNHLSQENNVRFSVAAYAERQQVYQRETGELVNGEFVIRCRLNITLPDRDVTEIYTIWGSKPKPSEFLNSVLA